MDEFAFLAFGVRIGVRVSRPGLARRLDQVLPPDARPISPARVDCRYEWVAGSGSRPHLLRLDTVQVVRATTQRTLLRRMASHIEQTLALRAPRRIFVHAGVVAWRGRALVLPGHSHAGKSRLVAALLSQGATYYSDEFAVLDARGRVHPFARKLSLRTSSDSTSRLRDASSFGARSGTRPIPVALVAMCTFDAHARWHPRPLSPAQGAMALLAHTVAARVYPRRCLTAIEAMLRHATVIRSARNEAQPAARALLAMIDALPRAR